jgi:hypothetical protein
MKLLATLYAVAFAGSALWSWGTYFATQHTEREHLLPGIIFNIVCLPFSLLMEPFIDLYPPLLDSAVLQQSLLTSLGLLQLACLVLMAVKFNRRSRSS